MYLIQVHTAISSLELKVKIGKAITAIATKVELAKASENFPSKTINALVVALTGSTNWHFFRFQFSLDIGYDSIHLFFW
jgi:hypothetical protein